MRPAVTAQVPGTRISPPEVVGVPHTLRTLGGALRAQEAVAAAAVVTALGLSCKVWAFIGPCYSFLQVVSGVLECSWPEGLY